MSGGRKAGGAAGSEVAPSARQDRIDRLWLGVLQRLSSGLAHELRNSLNGVAVNLEVVRSRSSREGVAATALGGFAGSASEQLEQVIAMTEALVALTRPARQPASIGRCADQAATLLRPALVAAGGSLDLAVEGEGTADVPADAARLLVTAAMVAVVEGAEGNAAGARDVRCRVRPMDGIELRVEGRSGSAPRLPSEVEAVAGELKVGVRSTPDGITLTFPAQGG